MKKSSSSGSGKASRSQPAKVSRTPPSKSASTTKKVVHRHATTVAAKPSKPGGGGPTKSEIVQTLDKLRSAKSVTEVTSTKKKLIDLIKKVKP